MRKTEIILTILILISLTGTLLLVPGLSIILALSMMALAVFYMYFSFALFNSITIRNAFKKESYQHITRMRIFGAFVAGLALSWALIGLLFKFQSYPGAVFMLYCGLMSLAAVGTVGLLKYVNNKAPYYSSIFKRMLIIGLPAFMLVILPRTVIVDFKYRNYPSYLDALQKSMADPTNQYLQDRANEEREKMYEDQDK